MSPQREAVLRYVREHPGVTDMRVHREAYRGSGVSGPSYCESTVKHLLALRRAGVIESVGKAHDWSRTWTAV